MSELSGPKFMTREEFKQYGAKLREKTQVYKRLKQELADIRYWVVVGGGEGPKEEEQK